MDLLGRYSSRVGGIARPDVVGVEYESELLHVKQPPKTHEKLFRAIQRSDLYLWTF